MNTAMFLLLMMLGIITLIYTGGMLFSVGLFRTATAIIIKTSPDLLLLIASSSLIFTIIALDFWQRPVSITLSQPKNIKHITRMALSQNALWLAWLILNKHSLANNFINIAAPVITTTILYQNFLSYLPTYLNRVALPQDGNTELMTTKYKYFWHNFSKNILNLVSKAAPHYHNQLLALDLINLYNEHSTQAKIIGLIKIIHKLKQHNASAAWLDITESMLNFLQKFAPEINIAANQKIVSGLTNLLQKLIIGLVDNDSETLSITIKKIGATFLELNNHLKSNNNIDLYVKIHICLAIQDIIKQLSSDKLHVRQDIENTNKLIENLEHTLDEQAKPDYFIKIMHNSLDNTPIIIKRLPDRKLSK